MTEMTTPPEPRLPVLGGRYRLVERIARGGMGEVWRGFDEVLGRPVAVKVLRPEYADEHVFLERFRNEARNTAALVHTGIAAVYDFGQTSMARTPQHSAVARPDPTHPFGPVSADRTVVPFIVMELVPGRPLSQIIERDGALERDRALDVVAQASRALNAAHCAGVVHRDVKPANLLITPSWAVKVTDFGIARAGDTLPLTRTGTVMGTAHYLAPELVNGHGVASPASDIYALGVVLYECLAGRRPFLGDNPLHVAMEHLNSTIPPIPGLHPAVGEVLYAALAKDPATRPGSAELFAHRLLALRIELAAGDPTPEAVARSLGEQADAAVVHRAASRNGGHRRGATGSRSVGTWAVPIPGRGAPASRTPDPRAVRIPVVPVTVAPAEAPTDPALDLSALRGTPAREPAGRHRAAAAPVRGMRWTRRRTVGLGGGLCAVVVLIAGLWVNDKDPRSSVVPGVEGSAEPEATREITAVGFVIKVNRQSDGTVPAGVVLSQSPAAGTRAATHSPVSILVSAGPPQVDVESAQWRGRPLADVVRGLQQLGLQVRRRDVTTGGAPGTVTDVSPRGNIPVGSSVTVTVVGAGGATASALAVPGSAGRTAR
jgi:serine/threonine-protein kinase